MKGAFGWWAQRRVDGVFLLDLQLGDHRVPVLEKLNIPALVISSPHAPGSLPAIWQNIQVAAATAVSHLAGLGHRRIGHGTGIARYWHTRSRTDALGQIAARS